MLSVDEVGVILVDAVQSFGTLEAACIHLQRDGAPLPAGLLTCGQACRMVAAVIGLATSLHPELLEPAVLEQAMRSYVLRQVGGEPN